MVNNYIIGKRRGETSTNLFFGKVESITKGIAYGVVEKDSHIKTLRAGFEIPVRDIVTDLGSAPHPGRVYGLEVTHRFVGRKIHDFFGSVCFMYKPPKSVSEKLFEAFDASSKILTKAGLPPPENAVWEINSSETSSKWAGYYKHSSKPEKNPHRFSIRPESVPQTVGDLTYVILHEYAHYLQANHATGKKLNARWIRLFNTSIKLQTIERSVSERLLKSLLDGNERPSDFRGQLEEEDRNAFNWIIRAVAKDHSVSIKELDLLFEAQYHDDIAGVWPKVTLNKKDLTPVVSEYATKNYHELFAEAISFYFTKKKLPESVVKLVEATIQYAKANQEKS
jgi:hypothetical protein